MTDSQWQAVRVILSLPGAIGFFLPFVYGVSPFEAALFWPGHWLIGSLGVVMGLSLCVFARQLRRAEFGRLSRPEIVACIILGVLGSVLVAANLVHMVIDDCWPKPEEIRVWAGLTVEWSLAAAHVIVVLRFQRQFFTDGDVALASLTAGYLPNAIFCLLAFEDWQVGAYVVLLACCCYLGMIANTARGSRRKSEPTIG